MTDVFIYVDADNIGKQSPTKFLHALKDTFGLHSQIKVFLTKCSVAPNPALCKACDLHDVELILVPKKPNLKESADIQMYATIYADLLEYEDEKERKTVTVVLASGDSDFYTVAWDLKFFVNVVVCGRADAHPLLKEVANYITYEMLVGEDTLLPLSVAKTFISDALQKPHVPPLLTVRLLETCLLNAHFRYSPLLFGPPQCFTTAELLERLKVRIDHPTYVRNILAQLDSIELPTVNEDENPIFKQFIQSKSHDPTRNITQRPASLQSLSSEEQSQIPSFLPIHIFTSQ
ncbi:hypothetical protein GEMRC1_005626 [Eukaryota sp. GEM-RC1]